MRGRSRNRRSSEIFERNRCRFCTETHKAPDYKDIDILQKLCTPQGKIYSRKRSGNCARHQRLAKKAIKRARFLALMPYTSRQRY